MPTNATIKSKEKSTSKNKPTEITSDTPSKEGNPPKKGIKEGTKKAVVEPDFTLKCNLEYLQLMQKLNDLQSDELPESIYVGASSADDEAIISSLPGITAGYLRTIKKNSLSFHSDLYKLAVLADYLGVKIIGSKDERGNALFTKFPKKQKKNPEIEFSGLTEPVC